MLLITKIYSDKIPDRNIENVSPADLTTSANSPDRLLCNQCHNDKILLAHRFVINADLLWPIFAQNAVK